MLRYIIIVTVVVMSSACGLVPHRYLSVSEPISATGADSPPRRRGLRPSSACAVRTSSIAIAAGALRLPLRQGEASHVREALLTFYLAEVRSFAKAKRDAAIAAGVAALGRAQLSVALTGEGFVVFQDGIRLSKSGPKANRQLRNGRLDRDEATLMNIEGGKSSVIRLPDLGTVGDARIRFVSWKPSCAARRTEAEDDFIQTVLNRLVAKTRS